MKIIHVENLVNELNVSEKIVFDELVMAIKKLEGKSLSIHYFLDESDEEHTRVFIVNTKDINLIRSSVGRLCLMDLAVRFNIDPKYMNWLLSELRSRNIIEDEVRQYYIDIKNRPSVKAWFEPDEIVVGEKATLNIEIHAPCEILEPTLSIDDVPGLKLDDVLRLPRRIFKGEYLGKYQYEAVNHGIPRIDIEFAGYIEGVKFGPEEMGKVTLRVQPLSPEIAVSSDENSFEAIYQGHFVLALSLANKGSGTAQNVELRGIKKHSEFEVFEPTRIGNIAPHGTVRYRINLRPRRSGIYRIEDLEVYYEDLAGKSFSTNVPGLEVTVVTPQPRLKIELLPLGTIEQKRIFSLITRIWNIGEGDAKNVTFALPIDPKLIQAGIVVCSLPKIRSNEAEEIAVKLKAPEEDEFNIPDFNVEMQDIEGNTIIDKLPGITLHVYKSEKDETIRARLPWPFQKNHLVNGQYQIVEEIGEGGFARVYRVNRTRMIQEEMALKALKADFVTNPTVVTSFIDEAKLSRSLREDHIVSVLYVDAEAIDERDYGHLEFPYIVMEYVKGGTLRDRLAPGERMDLLSCFEVMKDICSALVYAHQHGAIHFDIKPSNIFYDSEKRLWKLGDFGLAKATQVDDAMSPRGSLPYMAPELREERGSAKSDIYSLGKVLREMLTGDLNGDLRRLDRFYGMEYRENLRELANLIDRMLCTDPADRPGIGDVKRVFDRSRTWPVKMSRRGT